MSLRLEHVWTTLPCNPVAEKLRVPMEWFLTSLTESVPVQDYSDLGPREPEGVMCVVRNVTFTWTVLNRSNGYNTMNFFYKSIYSSVTDSPFLFHK